MSSILKAGLPPAPRPPVALPPIRYAAAAAAAVSSTSPATMGPLTPTSQATPNVLTTPASVPLTAPSIAPSLSQNIPDSQLLSSPSLTHPSVTSPMLSSASVSHQPDGSFYSGQDSPAISEAVPSSVSGPAASSSPQRATLYKGMLPDPTCWTLGKSIYRAYNFAYVAKGCLPCCPSTSFVNHYFGMNVTCARKQQVVSSDTQQPQANGAAQVAQFTVPQPAPTGPSPLPRQVQQPSTPGLPVPPSTSSQPPQYPPGVKVPPSTEPPSTSQEQPSAGMLRPPSVNLAQQAPSRPATTTFPGSLSDLVASFETVKQKGKWQLCLTVQSHSDICSPSSHEQFGRSAQTFGGWLHACAPTCRHRKVRWNLLRLSNSRSTIPRPKYYVPRHPFNTPSFYPQTPHPVLSSPALFSQIDVETLFYVFYYLPGTYQQYAISPFTQSENLTCCIGTLLPRN